MSKIFKSHRVVPKKEPYSWPIKTNEELRKAAGDYPKSKEEDSQQDSSQEEKKETSKEEMKTQKEAEEIIEKAKQEAEKQANEIIERAKAEEEQIKDEAKQKGYNEGFNEGYKEGENKAMNDIKEKEKELLRNGEKEVEKAIKKRKEMLSSIEREVCELVFLVAEKVLGKKVEEESELVVSLVKNGLLALEGQNKVIIKVHPNDYQKIEKEFEKIKEDFSELFIELREDANVPMRAPLLSVETGYMELDVSKQARELHSCVKQVILSD